MNLRCSLMLRAHRRPEFGACASKGCTETDDVRIILQHGLCVNLLLVRLRAAFLPPRRFAGRSYARLATARRFRHRAHGRRAAVRRGGAGL